MIDSKSEYRLFLPNIAEARFEQEQPPLATNEAILSAEVVDLGFCGIHATGFGFLLGRQQHQHCVALESYSKKKK